MEVKVKNIIVTTETGGEIRTCEMAEDADAAFVLVSKGNFICGGRFGHLSALRATEMFAKCLSEHIKTHINPDDLTQDDLPITDLVLKIFEKVFRTTMEKKEGGEEG